ncbi:iron ABC transporter permease [Dactylosporangium vinaceum]|uniref:FecCD family ABC transporter permease n=1 Tax=Dactylosporangium vinaceum TaxID=53362 RepID=A0ABV5MGB3_9ACTN|nr:iron ABC transporter permease [Dactylosporangium vinaceum]
MPPFVRIVAAVGVLVLVAVASLAVGARALGPAEVWRGLTDATAAGATVVRDLRLPRTVLGLLVGAALGLAGALMQALTRNPLADPGLLGVNAGASAAVVSAIAFLGVTDLSGYVWFAFGGAALVSVVVHAVAGGRYGSPGSLALSGTAVSAALYAYVAAVQLLDTASLDRMRFWTAGSLAAARPGTAWLIAPFVVVGAGIAALLGRPLGALALGDDSARALGAHPGRIRILAAVAIVLLCGAATAACGPIVFLGLMVPHLVRSFTGADVRLLLLYSGVLAPALLLAADVIGRVVARPGELSVGVVTAVLGGGFFLAIVRGRRSA